MSATSCCTELPAVALRVPLAFSAGCSRGRHRTWASTASSSRRYAEGGKTCSAMGRSPCHNVHSTCGPSPETALKVRLEIAVNENFVKPTILALQTAGQLDEDDSSGFGKIFVTELLDVVRIRTGESGPDAI